MVTKQRYWAAVMRVITLTVAACRAPAISHWPDFRNQRKWSRRGFLRWAVIGLGAVTVGGCIPERADIVISPTHSDMLDPEGNFILYVSNQSFAISRVDIRVSIDEKLILHRYFDVGNQHNWHEFKLRLAPGQHHISAESQKGSAKLASDFTVADKHWAVLNYWYYPPGEKYFDFTISDEPIGFAKRLVLKSDKYRYCVET